MLLVPSVQAQVLLGQKVLLSERVRKCWSQSEGNTKNLETDLKPKIPFTHKPVLPTARPGAASLFRASDSSHRDSETSTSQSWLPSWRNNIQAHWPT